MFYGLIIFLSFTVLSFIRSQNESFPKYQCIDTSKVCYNNETAGQRYRITLLKGFELKGFLRFAARMWRGRAERVNDRC